MDRLAKIIVHILMIVTVLISQGCFSNSSTRFYVLRSANLSEQEPIVTEEGFVLGLMPIRIPAYLDRSSLIIRKGPNQVHLEPVDEWAESLQDSVNRIFYEQLASLLGTGKVVPLPAERSEIISHRADLFISSFEANQDGAVEIAARWVVMPVLDTSTEGPSLGRSTTVPRHSGGVGGLALERAVTLSCDIERPAVNGETEQPLAEIVAAMNRCLHRLVREFAGSLRAMRVSSQKS